MVILARPAAHEVPASRPGRRIRLLNGAGVAQYTRRVGAVADRAFAGPPWSQGPSDTRALLGRLGHDAIRPGFTLAVAETAAGVVGFAYGLPARQLAWAAGHRDAWAPAVPFELRELAVVADARGLGIGAALHEAVLGHAGPGPGWLVTHVLARDPLGLYRSRGWHAMAVIAGPDGEQNRLLMRRPEAQR
jgi:GNAT superfamily N-acetyltransferase